MIPKLIKFCKDNNKELYLSVVIILVATISFGLGRLSKIREEKTPITIEDRGSNGVQNTLERPKFLKSETSVEIGSTPVAQNFGNISQSPKIFVASKNGKKYYYAWCESSQKIKESNRVWFVTKEEAEKSGYEPAANCKGLK